MPDDKYFLKVYTVDPRYTNNGMITHNTPLMPFYGDPTIANAVYLGNSSDARYSGENEKRNIIYNGNVYPGKGLYHGASGLAYVKDRSVKEPVYNNTGNTIDTVEIKSYDHDSDFDKYKMPLVLQCLLNNFYRARNKPVLVLASTKDRDIVSDDDIAMHNWDAWYDYPEEVQTKAYTPVEALTDLNTDPRNFSVDTFKDLLDKYFKYDDKNVLSDEQMKSIKQDFSNDISGLYKQRFITDTINRRF